VYWNLVDRYGYNANLYAHWSSAGNNTALQLVMDGMKIQPCRPGFVDGRNAILTADQALTGGANQCEIWRGFAKRGLGASASQGESTNRTDGVQAFDLPAACTASTFGGYREPIANAPTVNSRNAGSTINVGFGYLGNRSAIRLDSQNVDCGTLEITGQKPASIPTLGMIKIGNEFRFNWKTDPAWAGTCRRLTVRAPMASDGYAFFSFR
jgi:extracellular elastinolytic metalloproteinase